MNDIKVIFAAGILGIVILFSGCAVQQSTPTPGYDSYFPLIEGRVINYDVMSYVATDDVTADSSANAAVTETWQETWQYLGPVTITETIELFVINVISNGSETQYYYREDDTGVYRHGSGTSPSPESETMLKYPLVIGTTWESDSWLGPNEVYMEEVLTTEAGTFDCKVITYPTIPGAWHYIWVAKDVGIIREREGFGGIGTSWTSREIVSKSF